ncbi:hypothetical protein TNCV_3978591 [Trichonephila clavipes]|uniref:Uncharacterized protein n=1 Tax=Trichonephila clavipes TaxID=2585209 RepID=A0A8X7BL95_TRICX|nr:hypothetical protein TNCV_3978591 [Trichonephila clavipes]
MEPLIWCPKTWCPNILRCATVVTYMPQYSTVFPNASMLEADGFLNRLLCKAISTSATFVFIMNAVPDRFLSATDPVSRNRFSKSDIIDALGAFPPGYFC